MIRFLIALYMGNIAKYIETEMISFGFPLTICELSNLTNLKYSEIYYGLLRNKVVKQLSRDVWMNMSYFRYKNDVKY